MRHLKGLSLLEILLSTAVLGVVLTGLLGLTLGTMRFSAETVSVAERMQELTNASAYVGDNLRRASSVSTNITLDSKACQINPSAGNLPCIALVVPEAQAGTAIDTYLLLAYRLEPRSTLGANFKTANSWADSNTLVLMEYRKELCGGSSGIACNGAPTLPATVTGTQAYFVVDNLVKTNELPADFLSYDGSREFTLRFRVKDKVANSIRFTPETGVHELVIIGRNS